MSIARKTRHILTLTMFLAGLAGCTQGTMLQPTTSASDDEVSKNFALLTDIPIPPGASLDVERSLILGDLDRWTGRVFLKVGQPPAKIFAIYQTEMANFGWQPILSVQAGTSVLAFTRSERAATVQIESQTLGGSTVSVTVAPRQNGAVPGTQR